MSNLIETKSTVAILEYLFKTWCIELDIMHTEKGRPPPTPIEELFYCLYNLTIEKHDDPGRIFTLIPQHKIELGSVYYIDFVLNGLNKSLLIELDGHDFHEKTKKQAGRDKARDRKLQSCGYKIYHYTGSDVWNNFESILEDIRKFKNG